MPTRRDWITRANGLTLVRLGIAPALGIAIARGAPLTATILFWLAVATDFLDGWVARRYDESTAFGGLADHAVDAIFVAVGTGALAASGTLPVALPPLIAVAFLQYALDSRFLGARGLRGSSLGRWNGIAYYVIVATPIMRDAMGLAWPGATLVTLLGWALVGTTLASMVDRLRLLRRALAAE